MPSLWCRFCYQTEDIRYLVTKALAQHETDCTKAATMTLTSGSTGLPKAVVHNISAHLANAEGVCALMNFGKEQSWLLFTALSCFWTRYCVALTVCGSNFSTTERRFLSIYW